MIAGGIVGSGVYGGDRCENGETKQISTGDYNHDGVEDKIYRVSYSAGCKPDVYIELAKTDLSLTKVASLGFSYLSTYSSEGFSHFSNWDQKFRAASKRGATLFGENDLVKAPFGPKSDAPTTGRIRKLVVETDQNFRWIRTVAEILTPYGRDHFDLSALTLISPAIELDRQAKDLTAAFRKTQTFRKREAILQYADYHNLRPRFRKEVDALETKIALTIEERVKKLDLDRPGKKWLMGKIGEQLELSESVSGLVRKAKRPQDFIPTSTTPSITSMTCP